MEVDYLYFILYDSESILKDNIGQFCIPRYRKELYCVRFKNLLMQLQTILCPYVQTVIKVKSENSIIYVCEYY